MTQGFRQSQSTLHTWSGLLLGWVLFVIFVTGTIAFWREGLNRWMRPELAPVERPMRVLAGAQRFLQRSAADATTWYITLPDASSPGAQLFWIPPVKSSEARPHRGRRDNQALIDGTGAPVTARETRGGEFFYRFHFDLQYMPVVWARWLVGIAAMMMLVAILTGIVTHKKIFRDFFTLRRGRGQRSWLDGHNATAVLALPFHLMMTYTGIVTLMAMLMPWAVVANYTDPATVSAALFPQAPVMERTGRAVPLVDLARIVTDAERRLGGSAGFVTVSDPGDAAARVTVTRAPTALLNTRTPAIAYDGTNGVMVWRSPALGGAAATVGVMIGLHAGRYADTALRWIYFLGGVAGCVMVASGLVLWTVKRRDRLPNPDRPHPGFRIVECLNIAVVGGFPLGIATMFWANRLLPVAMENRAQWEVHCLFIAWAAALLATLALRPRVAWTMLLALTGTLLIVLPFYNLLGTTRGIVAAAGLHDWLFVGVDLTLLVFGAAFLAIARRVARFRRAAPRRRAAARARPAFDNIPLPEPAE